MKKIFMLATAAVLVCSLAMGHDGDKKTKAKKTCSKTCGKECSKRKSA